MSKSYQNNHKTVSGCQKFLQQVFQVGTTRKRGLERGPHPALGAGAETIGVGGIHSKWTQAHVEAGWNIGCEMKKHLTGMLATISCIPLESGAPWPPEGSERPQTAWPLPKHVGRSWISKCFPVHLDDCKMPGILEI